MGNPSLYVKTARNRSKGLRERFLIQKGQGIDIKELIAGLTEEEWGLFEERAGIMELDGGLSRKEAELRTLREFLKARKNGKG
jgi:hypothetical protein